jgi:hypothetical protein
MMLLGRVMDKKTARLSFTVNLADINEDFCNRLSKLARKHKGDVPLQAIVADPSKGLSLTLDTQELRVASHDILAELERLPGVVSVTPIHKQ